MLPPGVYTAPPTAEAADEIFVVNSTADVVDATPGDGICATAGSVCTLRAAVQEANALAGAQTITLPDTSGTPYVVSLTSTQEDAAATGDLDIIGSVTIPGDCPGGCIISVAPDGSGYGIDRAVHIHAGMVTFPNLRIEDGSAVNGDSTYGAGTAYLSGRNGHSQQHFAGQS